MTKKIFTILFFCLLVVAAIFALSNNRKIAPAFKITELNSSDIISEQLFQGKVTLLNFWYPSCPSCIAEIPKLIAIKQKFSNQNYQTLAIALNNNTEAEVRAYLTQYPLPFIVAYDKDLQTAQAYGVQLTPTSFLIDSKGKIIRSYIGEPDWAELETEITHLLKTE